MMQYCTITLTQCRHDHIQPWFNPVEINDFSFELSPKNDTKATNDNRAEISLRIEFQMPNSLQELHQGFSLSFCSVCGWKFLSIKCTLLPHVISAGASSPL